MTKVAFPARCAVAVIHDHHLLSQVYPAAVPIETYLDNVVELINDDLKRRGAPGLDPAVAYELQRPNGTPLDATRTLDELGIEDGTTLVLMPAGEGEDFEPHYESLSTGLARISRRLFAPVTARTASATALAILGLAVTVIAGLTVRTRLAVDSPAPAAVSVAIGILLAAGAIWVRRWWPARHDLVDPLAWLAVPPLAVGLAAFPPGRPAAGHVVIAALAAAVAAGALGALTRRHLTLVAAVVTTGSLGALAAAVRMWQPVPAQRLGMSALIALLVVLAGAPTVALWAARLRPPHFGSITGRDLFNRDDGMPADAVAPVPDEPEESDGTPRGAAIAESAERANAVLTGICLGAAITLPVAVWTTVMPGRSHANAAAVLSLLFVLIFVSRARSFADRRQAVALVCGAAAAFCAGVIRYVTHPGPPSAAPLVWGTLVLVAFAGAALASGLIVPATRFTPLVRVVVEWAELVAITAALPLAAWIGGLFTWLRMR